MTYNAFTAWPGQILASVHYDDGTIDAAPFGSPSAEALIQASSLARDWSLGCGVESSVVWSPEEKLVSRFVKGRLQAEKVNQYAGLL